MKLLVVAEQWFPDYDDGSARLVSATAKGLAGRLHEVVALVPGAPREPAFDIVNGVEVHRVLYRSHVTHMFKIRRAINAVLREQFDVILAYGSHCAIAAQSARTDLPIAFVVHSSETGTSQDSSSSHSSWTHLRRNLVQSFQQARERRAVQRAHRIIVLSESSRSLVLKIDPSAVDRLCIVGDGIDTSVLGRSGWRVTVERWETALLELSTSHVSAAR